MAETQKPNIIYHITTEEAWDIAKENGELTAPSLQTEGFVHASTHTQLCDTADRYYANIDPEEAKLIALTIDTRLLPQGALVYEASFSPASQGQIFPHIYAAIPLDAISNPIPLRKNNSGQYTLPT